MDGSQLSVPAGNALSYDAKVARMKSSIKTFLSTKKQCYDGLKFVKTIVDPFLNAFTDWGALMETIGSLEEQDLTDFLFRCQGRVDESISTLKHKTPTLSLNVMKLQRAQVNPPFTVQQPN